MKAARVADRMLKLRAGASPVVTPPSALALSFLRGMGAAQTGDCLERLLSLCGPAHRVASELAWAALRETQVRPSPVQAAALRRTALREHLRHLWLDWPVHLANRDATAAEVEELGVLWRALDGGRGFAEVLGERLFGVPADWWLRERNGLAAPSAWKHAPGAPLQVLRGVADIAQELELAAGACLESRMEGEWQALARAAFADPDFADRPRLDGACAQTGAWARTARRRGVSPVNALERWLARLDDVAVLALDDDALRGGAHAVDARHGMAWVETARGVLIHLLAVDAAGGVASYRIASPTQWNFHPQGVLAQAMVALPAAQRLAGMRLLAAVGDPCVPFAVEASASESTNAQPCREPACTN